MNAINTAVAMIIPSRERGHFTIISPAIENDDSLVGRQCINDMLHELDSGEQVS